MSVRHLFEEMLRDPDPDEGSRSVILGLLLWCFSLGFALSIAVIFGTILVWLPWSLLLLVALLAVWGFVSIRDRVD